MLAEAHEQDAGALTDKDPSPTAPPPPPVPSTDPKLVRQAQTPPPLHAAPTPSSQDLFKLAPVAALKLLGAGIEALVRMTGDVPPTPPPTSPTIPNIRDIQREKVAIVRSHSEKNLARLHEQAAQAAAAAQAQAQPGAAPEQPPRPLSSDSQPIDGVHLRQTQTQAQTQTPTATPPRPQQQRPPTTPAPYIVVGANSQPLNQQHSAITRKFFSKAPPPISIEAYLLRLHRFCPMSTAVYLATSFYIFRLAVDERAIPVTARNAHRLLLAGLRVAMKALEDLSYPHARVAKVGGVSEVELARLEISFCFLAGFELVVREDTLRRHWETLRQGQGEGGDYGFQLGGVGGVLGAPVPALRLEPRRKKNVDVEAGAVAG
ncbi:cyclin-domain-containing protein [Whalleya microplaca]|nr:cyclin-domain-containing protein [Whalleya microplaca]